MDITRRGFLRISGGAALAGGMSISLEPDAAGPRTSQIGIHQGNNYHLPLLRGGLRDHRTNPGWPGS